MAPRVRRSCRVVPRLPPLGHWNVGKKLKQQLPVALRPLSAYKILRFIINIFTAISVTNSILSPIENFQLNLWYQNFPYIKFLLFISLTTNILTPISHLGYFWHTKRKDRTYLQWIGKADARMVERLLE